MQQPSSARSLRWATHPPTPPPAPPPAPPPTRQRAPEVCCHRVFERVLLQVGLEAGQEGVLQHPRRSRGGGCGRVRPGRRLARAAPTLPRAPPPPPTLRLTLPGVAPGVDSSPGSGCLALWRLTQARSMRSREPPFSYSTASNSASTASLLFSVSAWGGGGGVDVWRRARTRPGRSAAPLPARPPTHPPTHPPTRLPTHPPAAPAGTDMACELCLASNPRA